MKHPHRIGLTAAVGAALCLPMLAVTTAATAHEGHDDTAPPPPAGSFQKVTLNDRPGEAIDLAVLPDGDVLHTTRAGVIWHNDADTGVNSVAGRIPVYLHDEEGLQSIALDPGYDGKKNKWIYLYYSPPLDTPADDPATASINEGDAPETGTAADFAPYKGHLTVSRFRFSGGQVDVGSEQKVLDVPVDRGICCHVGGDIVFDSAGNLILSTGDDTNPFQSDGYVPLDERPDRNPAFDAQRTSANTNDLRGKILRITPKAGGGYTIPEGNLFAPGTPEDPPGDLLDGLAQPVPHRDRPRHRRHLGRRLLARRPGRQPRPRPRRPRQVGGRGQAVQLRLALLRHRRAALQRLRLRHPHERPEVQLRRPGQRLDPQHRPARAAAGGAAGGLVLVRPLVRVPRARDRRHRPDGRPGVPVRQEGHQGSQPRRLAQALRRHPAVLRVDPRLHQGLPRRRRRRSPRSRTSSPTS